ncbi:hypothetical protein RQP46_001625 [Phenoliferia psychrophenolica]
MILLGLLLGLLTLLSNRVLAAAQAQSVNNATVEPVGPFWTVNYPAGTRIFIDALDANGNAGGPGSAYTVVDGSNTCTFANSSAPFSFTASPAANPCDEIGFNIVGGTAPFTLSVINDHAENLSNVTDIVTMPILVANDVPAGKTLAVTFLESGLGTAGCEAVVLAPSSQLSYAASLLSTSTSTRIQSSSTNSPSSSTSPLPTPSVAAKSTKVVAAAVGGSLGALAVLGVVALLWYLRRRRNTNEKGAMIPMGHVGGAPQPLHHDDPSALPTYAVGLGKSLDPEDAEPDVAAIGKQPGVATTVPIGSRLFRLGSRSTTGVYMV